MTYSYLAASQYQSDAEKQLACDSIDDVFAAILKGQAQIGVVPLRNSFSGLVSDTADSIVRRLIDVNDSFVGPWWKVQLCISSCFSLSVRHCLVGWGSLSDVQSVLSKQQAIQQCQGWLTKNVPHAQTVSTDSSAGSIAQLKIQPHCAAIVSREAAQEASVPILAADIQDDPNNQTEFVAVQCDSQPKREFADAAEGEFVEYWAAEFRDSDPAKLAARLKSIEAGNGSQRLCWQHCFELGQRYYWFGKIVSMGNFSQSQSVTASTAGNLGDFLPGLDCFNSAWRLGVALGNAGFHRV